MKQIKKRLLSNKRIQRVTGVKKETFNRILKKVKCEWGNASKRKKKAGRPHAIGGLEEHLLLLLMYYYCYCSHLFLAAIFKTDESTIGRSIKRIDKIVSKKIALESNRQITEDEVLLVVLDATEPRIQRPKNNQKEYYSGKKKCHTIKTEIAIDSHKKILRVSESYSGKKHDFGIRKNEAPFPSGVAILADSGYQGLQDLHDGMVILPKKSSKNHPLSDDDRRRNRKLSRCRVGVEHVFCALKRFKILANPFRGSLAGYGPIFLSLAGIYNLALGF